MKKLKRNFAKIIFLNIAILLVINSCSQKKMAPITTRGKTYQKSIPENNNQIISKGESITITPGDTVYSISRKTGIPIRDLIAANNFQPPYNLVVGSKVNIPAAKYHEVASGETLFSIARQHDMNVNNLIEINNLQKPYTIKIGDKLRISNTAPTEKAEVSPAIKNSAKIVSKNLDEEKPASEKPSKTFFFGKKNNFIWPVKGKVISSFGHKAGGLYNDGINIKAAKGTSVKAVEEGSVAYVGNELRGYGNLIIVKHSGGWISAYAHLDKAKVNRGDKVKQGAIIATVGKTGNVDTPQLYFGIRKGRDAVNPQNYLK